jgi:hypothetical protein
LPFSQKIKDLIFNAREEGHVCLLGTTGPNGPNISPKGSMMIFDDDHLAYWERSKKTALENLRHDNRVIVVYSNLQAQWDGVLDSGVLRFYGTAELHDSGAVWDAVRVKLSDRERDHEGAENGIAVLIRLTRAQNVRGGPIE